MEWINAPVTSRHEWAEGLVTLEMDVVVDFVPGQFANIAIERDGQRVRRSYSIASAPGRRLELFITLVPGGALTPDLFDLSVGDPVWVQSKGAGLLTLESPPPFATDLWLISTGTGLAPYLSMLRAGLLERYPKVVVVHGVRQAAHLGYADELSAAARDSAGRFCYIPTVTRDAAPPGGFAGRVTTLLASGELERVAGVNLSAEHSYVMLCGNPDMVTDVMADLAGRGLQRHRRKVAGNITIERYW